MGPGQAAEQIIAGVVLSERLAVTMYGAIHRAQFNGQRNLRGLVVDSKILAEDAFRIALTDPKGIERVAKLDHPNIVPTLSVESGGPDVVVVSRGVGRYVTVQDLITAAKARSKQGGKLSTPIAGLIGRSVIEALAVAHKAGVIHGAVHPRSVLIDEDGGVRIGDFVAGRALTTAVAQGADSSLWRGLAGYIAPELVVGEDPTAGVDVFAVGAMLFTMLSGEVPPGGLRVTPAIERLVQRALDTDVQRRYKNASDLLENLLEAMEDDRWELADKAELIREAGLSRTDDNIDDATEDLLASLGSKSSAVQVTPLRPSVDLRAEAAALKSSKPSGSKLDALLADLDDHTGITRVDDVPQRKDPISEIVRLDPRAREAIVSPNRVPSLDDPDDDPAPAAAAPRRGPSPSAAAARRGGATDEQAALAAIGDLDEGAKRVSSAAEQAVAAAAKLEEAAQRAERAAQRAETGADAADAANAAKAKPAIAPRPVAPLADIPADLDYQPPRLKSRWPGVIGVAAVLGLGYFGYRQYASQEQHLADNKAKADEQKKEHDEAERKAIEGLPDPGAIKVTSNPSEGGVWLKIGRTPVDSLPLSSAQMHELRIEGVDGFQPVDTQVVAAHWSGEKDKRKATIVVALKPIEKDAKTGKPKPVKLPVMPPKPPDATGFAPGRGPIHIESTPPGAEVWMFLGMTNQMELTGIQAGLPYELRVLKDGFLPGYVSISVDEWRDGGDPNVPINAAKKKSEIEKNVDLVADPNAPTDGSGSKKAK